MKPICKIINGIPNYATKFSLGAVNEIKRTEIQAMAGDSALSRAELKALAGENATAEEIGAAAQMHMKIPVVAVSMLETIRNSLRLRHSLCNADGVLLYKSVDQMESVIKADEVDELLALVAEANPVKTIAEKLEEAEKN